MKLLPENQWNQENNTFADDFFQYMFADVPCFFLLPSHLGSLVVELIKNLPAVQETQVQSLGWENLLEKEMATHSSILAWEIS